MSIRFVKSVVLKGFYIEDLHGDTLIYSKELSISINDISTQNRTLRIGKVSLVEGNFSLVQYKGEAHDNLFFITEYFSSGDTSAGGKPWKIEAGNFVLKDFRFRHDIQDDTALVRGVDFSHLDVSGINGEFRNFSTLNDSIFVDIRKLSFHDHSGFSLDEFSGDAKVSDTEIRIKKLVIKTPHTDLHTDLTFQYDSFPCFDEFTSRVRWNSDFKDSKVSFSDIAYFAPDLYGIDKSLKLAGDFHGLVNNFKGKNILFQWGDQSEFIGNVSIKGLPYINDTYFEVTAEKIKTNKRDVEWLPVPPFEEGKTLEVPENLNALGVVTFKGKFTGFVTDFVAYGNINTAIGSLNSDLNLKINPKNNSSVYSGHLAANNFDAGKISDVSDLGNVTFSVDLKGTGLKLDEINAILEGKISELVFKNYNYKNLEIDGQVSKKLFNGSLAVKEPNVDFDFSGSIDFRGKLPEFNFVADIKTAHLDTLNLFRTKDKTILQTLIRTNFRGNKLDNIVGTINVENTNFIYGNKQYHLSSIKITDDKNNGTRTFDVQSDAVDAHLAGDFELLKVVDAFKEIIPKYLPSVILPSKTFQSKENFTYDIRIKNMNLFTELFIPKWSIAPNTTIAGHFNRTNNIFALDLKTEWIRFKELGVENFNLKTTAENTTLTVDAKAAMISKSGNNFILMPGINAVAENNRLNYKISLSDLDTVTNSADFRGAIDFFSASRFNVKVDSSIFIVENEEWKLDKNNQLIFDSSEITVTNFQFSKAGESIRLDGVYGKKSSDRIALLVKEFDLRHLNALISGNRSSNSAFGGIVNGEVFLTDPFNQFQLESDLKISNLSFDKDTLGNASLMSRYIGNQDMVVSNISIIKGVAKVVDISGSYYISRSDNKLDFNIKLNNFYLHPLEPYISDIMREVYGKVSADLSLKGTFSKPVLDGTVSLNKTSLIVNYLNTRYSFNSTINVRENQIELDGVTLVDVNTNQATLKGTIYHDYFKNFRFDVEMTARNFQVLNTTSRDNLLYYGLANASGYAHFRGPIENMSMDISLSPDKGTKISIPLNTLEDISGNSFITFIDRTKDTSLSITRNIVNLSGISLNMNLDMNRNAEIKIIFDEKIGDVITGSGTGSLRLDINTNGNFNMFGTYVIERGEYLFTLQNLINKKFSIVPGGKITWAGDPYNAVVDLSAIYTVHTSSLYNILQDTTYRRRVPVECKLILTNKLMNPTINYEIHVQGLDPTVEGLLSTKLNSEQEINKQMFSLLMFNQFIAPTGAGQAGTRIDASASAGATASELLSNQVSNWLGQLNKSFDLSINYHAKDTYTPEELRLLFSKTLLNDRLTIETNVGFLGDQTYLNNNVVGDFNVEYKVSEDGRFRVKVFNRSNADDIIKYSQSPYTQGIGFFYRKDFNTFRDLLRKKKKTEEETSK